MNEREIYEERIKNKYPNGFYVPEPGHPNYEICNWLQQQINNWLSNNVLGLKIRDIQFDFIHSDEINACADTQGQCKFIGVTKGLVDYSSFIFSNYLSSNYFLNDLFTDNIQKQSEIIDNDLFFSWNSFCIQNSIDYNSLKYTPTDPKRKTIAEALFLYFIYFIVLHEIGHLNQKEDSLFEFNDLNIATANNLEKQILEMDSDKYAVNELAKHLMSCYDNISQLESKNLFFFENKKGMVRYVIFMLFNMFYIFSSNNKFEKYILEFSHPHPALRVNYSITLLLDIFTNNSFVSISEREELGKQSIVDFAKVFEKIFPNSKLNKYFNLIRDKDLLYHHETLQNGAKQMSNLNGKY